MHRWQGQYSYTHCFKMFFLSFLHLNTYTEILCSFFNMISKTHKQNITKSNKNETKHHKLQKLIIIFLFWFPFPYLFMYENQKPNVVSKSGKPNPNQSKNMFRWMQIKKINYIKYIIITHAIIYISTQ